MKQRLIQYIGVMVLILFVLLLFAFIAATPRCKELVIEQQIHELSHKHEIYLIRTELWLYNYEQERIELIWNHAVSYCLTNNVRPTYISEQEMLLAEEQKQAYLFTYNLCEEE